MSVHKMSSQVLEQIARHVPSSIVPSAVGAGSRRRRVATAPEAAARLHPRTPLPPAPPHLIFTASG